MRYREKPPFRSTCETKRVSVWSRRSIRNGSIACQPMLKRLQLAASLFTSTWPSSACPATATDTMQRKMRSKKYELVHIFTRIHFPPSADLRGRPVGRYLGQCQTNSRLRRCRYRDALVI